MGAESNYWLILEKSEDTRIAKANAPYRDLTGELYEYDSLVPNHTNLKQDDFLVLRKEDEIVGVGTVGKITTKDGTKTLRRCPKCRGTDTRERKSKTPRWKCGKCALEFEEPVVSESKVTLYAAQIEDFCVLTNPPTVKDVKACALGSGNGIRSQLSIIKLDPAKVIGVMDLAGSPLEKNSRKASRQITTQGFGLSAPQKKAVEECAMVAARRLYESKGFSVRDVSKTKPFDLLAQKGSLTRFIEVKGSTGDGAGIILTRREVMHMKSNPSNSVLVVISSIGLRETPSGWEAVGGLVRVHADPFELIEAKLSATQFMYDLR
jgi:hypothetical protein